MNRSIKAFVASVASLVQWIHVIQSAIAGETHVAFTTHDDGKRIIYLSCSCGKVFFDANKKK